MQIGELRGKMTGAESITSIISSAQSLLTKLRKRLDAHIRRRRIGLKLLQNVAERLGVNKTSLFNWEANTSTPEIRYMPAIIEFLGYNPLPEATAWGARLVRYRTTLGMTQKEAAAHLGVDQGTLARWERGEREPQGAFLGRVKRFLQGENAARGLGSDQPGNLGERRCADQTGNSVVRGLLVSAT